MSQSASGPADPVALGTEPAEPPLEPDALHGLRTARYDGHDPRHLVTAVVDGEGLVVRISFAGQVATQSPEVVEEAVLRAISVAQQRVNDAWTDFARTASGAGAGTGVGTASGTGVGPGGTEGSGPE